MRSPSRTRVQNRRPDYQWEAERTVRNIQAPKANNGISGPDAPPDTISCDVPRAGQLHHWTDQENKELVKALNTVGPSWEKVSALVGTRNARSCSVHFRTWLRKKPIWKKQVRAMAFSGTDDKGTVASAIDTILTESDVLEALETLNPQAGLNGHPETGLEAGLEAFDFDGIVALGPMTHLSQPVRMELPSPSHLNALPVWEPASLPEAPKSNRAPGFNKKTTQHAIALKKTVGGLCVKLEPCMPPAPFAAINALINRPAGARPTVTSPMDLWQRSAQKHSAPAKGVCFNPQLVSNAP